MKTRSRRAAGESKLEEEAQAAPATRSTPRSKKRRASETSSAAAPAAETKKPKGAAPADAVTTPPPKAPKSKSASLQEAKKSTPSMASKGAVSRGKAVEDQSLPNDNDQEAGAAVTAGLGVAPKGRCVSGRVWKARNQSQRASMQRTTATETLSSSWAKKLEIKAKRQAIMAMEKEMRDTKLREIEERKQEKLEREKRRQRNEMKNTTYQTISKTHKMKTMSKKQLRQIKKRQINSRTGEVEFVSPWGGGNKK
eukprot:g6177.t1